MSMNKRREKEEERKREREVFLPPLSKLPPYNVFPCYYSLPPPPQYERVERLIAAERPILMAAGNNVIAVLFSGAEVGSLYFLSYQKFNSSNNFFKIGRKRKELEQLKT